MNLDSCESGTWHVLAIGESSKIRERLRLTDRDFGVWGTAGRVALIASEQSGLDVRVRVADGDRWRSLRRVAGTAEYEFRRHWPLTENRPQNRGNSSS